MRWVPLASPAQGAFAKDGGVRAKRSPAEGTTLSGACLGRQNGERRSLSSIEPEKGMTLNRAICHIPDSLSVRFATVEPNLPPKEFRTFIPTIASSVRI